MTTGYRLPAGLSRACLLGLLALTIANCGGEGAPPAGHSPEAEAARPAAGGRLAVALGADPKTLNPVFAADRPSKEVIGRMMADLIHINRYSQSTESALAESWTVSDDGSRFRLALRQGVKFSDGEPFDADDVVFSFRVIQDEAVGSPNRDLLVLDGKPIAVTKIDSHTVEFDLGRPHAVGERVFDSILLLPSHLLEPSYLAGTLSQSWTLDTAPEEIAGLGPFRFKSYAPGEQVVLERNPHYWKKDESGAALPHLDELVFRITPSQDTQLLRFQGGEIDIIDDLTAASFELLEAGARAPGYQLFDLGAGLKFNFVFFNLNRPEATDATASRKYLWFSDKRFRQAVSAAVDRQAIARLVFQNRATPIWSHVSPGNKPWFNAAVPRPARSLERARGLLGQAGFDWNEGGLVDADGVPVTFSLVTNSNNGERVRMMTIIQEDLRELGIDVQVVPLEFQALINRIFQTKNYDLCVLALGGGDVDPSPIMNVLLSTGATHLWNPGEDEPETAWQAEIDRLMTGQTTALVTAERKAMYDRVQEIVSEELPLVPLVSPNVLVGAKAGLGNFKPAILDHQTLWNVEEMYWRSN